MGQQPKDKNGTTKADLPRPHYPGSSVAFVLCTSHTVSLGHVDTRDLPLSLAGRSSAHRHEQSDSDVSRMASSEISHIPNKKNE